MIETDYFILTEEQFFQTKENSEKLNISVDYYLLEFCTVDGPWINVTEGP